MMEEHEGYCGPSGPSLIPHGTRRPESCTNESVGHRAESGVKLLPENTVGSRGQICLICDYIDTYMI